MADLRILSSLPAIAASNPARTTEAIRAAQRAFFDAALSNAAAPAVLRPTAPAAATEVSPNVSLKTLPPASIGAHAAPSRALRPGSLLDIRV